ncbi:MAG: T9SS type A sorting domain-containing protein, partial [Bacteroidales bacterium]|nr:T9SS type A sorting domain-containing protein [Bacteroidales bacterium]
LATLGLQDAALAVVASGFLAPENNSNGPAFGLWVALPAGGSLVALTNTSGTTESPFVVESITIYPNPTSEVLNIQYGLNLASDITIEIYDMLGSKISGAQLGRMNAIDHIYRLNVSEWKGGIYFVTIRSGEVAETRKIQVVN